MLGAVAVVVIRRPRRRPGARTGAVGRRSSGWRSLATAYSDQETGERGYALTGAAGVPRAVHRWQRAGRGADARSSASVARRAAESAAAPSRSSRPVQTWRREAAEVEIALRDTPGARSEAADAVATGTGAALFDRVRARLGVARRIGLQQRGRCRGRQPRHASAPGSPGCSSPSRVSPSSARSPPRSSSAAGSPVRSTPSARRCAGSAPVHSTRRSGSPGHRSCRRSPLDVDAMRGRIRQQLRRFRALTRGGRAERGGGADAALGARARRRADSRRVDGRRARSAPPRAWSRATATTCSSPSRATSP